MKAFISASIFVLAIFSFSAFAQNDAPKVIKYVAPKYPVAAQAVRASGTVAVNVKIDKEGKVVSAEAISGHPLLRKVCEIAAKEWIFSSGLNVNEREVKVIFILRIGNRNKKDKVKFRKPYTLELVGARLRIIIDKHPGY